MSRGEDALVALQIALQRALPTEAWEEPIGDYRRAPHFRSGLRRLDEWPECPGPYGVTALAAPAKAGKTLAALAAALETAATQDWRVVYFNAELDATTMRDRLRAYIGAHPSCEDAMAMLDIYDVRVGVTPAELTRCVMQGPGPEPVLVVLDSVNTIAKLAGGRYFDQLERFSLWAMTARKESEGSCAFLIVSETNKSGGIKGEQLHYWADLVLRLKPQESTDYVEIDITHSRSTPRRYLGRHLRNMQTGSLVYEYDIGGGLRVVPGGYR